MRENLQAAKGKHVLIDTNIIIDAIKDAKSFMPLFGELADIKAVPMLDEIVCFEFLRSATSNSEKKKMELFLKDIFGDPAMLVPDKNIIEEATKIAMVYRRHQSPSVDLTDCFLAAQAERYKNNLLILTKNHKDYPSCIFDCLGVFAMCGDKNEIHTIGLYGFNHDRYKSHLDRL